MWVKLTDPLNGVPQWVNLDAVMAMKRIQVDRPRSKKDRGTSGKPPKSGDTVPATRMFCAQGTVDCFETPEEVLGVNDQVRRVVLATNGPAKPAEVSANAPNKPGP